MPAAGGTDGESYGDAHARFSHVLLSRSRIVTADDLKVALKAFDRRIKGVEMSARLRRTDAGLQKIQVVTAQLAKAEFTDPEEEKRILEEDLHAFLRQRTGFDTELQVECRWADEGEPR